MKTTQFPFSKILKIRILYSDVIYILFSLTNLTGNYYIIWNLDESENHFKKSPFSCKFQTLFLKVNYYDPVNICIGKIHM